MSKLNAYGVAVDVELFELIELSYKTKRYSKEFIKRVTKFILNTDHISGCLLIQATTIDLVCKLADNDALLTYVVKFIKVHSVSKIDKMLGARYGDELRRLELRLPAAVYANLVRLFQ